MVLFYTLINIMTMDIGQYGFYHNPFKYSLKFLPYPEFFPL